MVRSGLANTARLCANAITRVLLVLTRTLWLSTLDGHAWAVLLTLVDLLLEVDVVDGRQRLLVHGLALAYDCSAWG